MHRHLVVFLPLISAAWPFMLASTTGVVASRPRPTGTLPCFLHRTTNKSNAFRPRPIAHPALCPAPVATPVNAGAALNATSPPPRRCSSREAATLIRDSAARDGLLVVTCDASGRGGGSKHDGIAGVLRLRHGASEGRGDLLDATFRRTAPSPTSSEAAALALGMKQALRVPAARRRRVLLLSDSECALDFFCGRQRDSLADPSAPALRRTGRRKRRKGTASERGRGGTASREEAQRRALLALAAATPTAVLFAKVRSSSRGARIGAADEGEREGGGAAWDGIGFVDHDAADSLSGTARSVANTHDGELKNAVSDETEQLRLREVAPLGEGDLAWLRHSENEQGRTIEVVGSEARAVRQQRDRRRMEIIRVMLGPLA